MAVKRKAFLSLEKSLTARLVRPWNKYADTLAKNIVKAVKDNDLGKVEKLLNAFTLQEVLGDYQKYLAFISKSSVLYGVSALRAPAQSRTLQSYDQYDQIENAQKQFEYYMENTGQVLESKVTRLIDQYLRAVQKADIVQDFASLMDSAVTDAGRQSIQIASGLHTSRLASFGFLNEATALGYTRYSISEQLDTRVCEVCRTMHGKTFEVQRAYDRLNFILRLDNPEELRQHTEWPSQSADSVDQLRKSSESDLQARGLDTPPYHPGCRGVTVKLGDAPISLPVSPTELQPIKTGVDKNSLKPFFRKGKVAQKDVDNWLEVVGNVNPGLIVEALSRGVPKKAKKFLDIEPDSVMYNLSWGTKTKKNYYKVQFRRDDNVPGAFVSALQITQDYRGLAKSLVQDTVTTAKDLGMPTVGVKAGKKLGSYAWAKYGFVPVGTAWGSVAEHVSTKANNLLKSNKITQAQQELIAEAINQGPNFIWTLAALQVPINKKPLGQYLLEGVSWEGELQFTNAESMEQFNLFYTSALKREASAIFHEYILANPKANDFLQSRAIAWGLQNQFDEVLVRYLFTII